MSNEKPDKKNERDEKMQKLKDFIKKKENQNKVLERILNDIRSSKNKFNKE